MTEIISDTEESEDEKVGPLKNVTKKSSGRDSRKEREKKKEERKQKRRANR